MYPFSWKKPPTHCDEETSNTSPRGVTHFPFQLSILTRRPRVVSSLVTPPYVQKELGCFSHCNNIEHRYSMATAPTAQQLAAIAAAAQPLQPEGRALAFLVVTIVLLVLSVFFVSVRLWYRLWKLRASKVWGWEDILALMGLITYVICSAYGILLAYYGLGTPVRAILLPTSLVIFCTRGIVTDIPSTGQ